MRVRAIPWPSMSPDLNPIENVWSLMVHELEEELRQPARQLNQDELWAAVLAKWEELRRRPGYFRSLVASMRQRLEQCSEAAGGHTSY
ncbi:Transposable element Tcb1 transposase [Amphibalanus amphitrite]|uniref:Transposable element Tcb1 transposase n=1 Tax=Amphibalanus amphitrite TaxID=1232801 RepID=A0A6A4W0E2_AMPAM|nr:Transposable element Tcb1 transposase [Amphibalanus amphitrite]